MNFNVPFFGEDSDLHGYGQKLRKRRKRVRRMTLASVIAQARKIGVAVVTVSADGSYTLDFNSETATTSNGHAIETADELRRLI
jgi:hypothetical protein